VNHQATVYTYNLYLSISLMVTVAIRALVLEYLVKILDCGQSRAPQTRKMSRNTGVRVHNKSLQT
jgi:hypothetical protein